MIAVAGQLAAQNPAYRRTLPFLSAALAMVAGAQTVALWALAPCGILWLMTTVGSAGVSFAAQAIETPCVDAPQALLRTYLRFTPYLFHST